MASIPFSFFVALSFLASADMVLLVYMPILMCRMLRAYGHEAKFSVFFLLSSGLKLLKQYNDFLANLPDDQERNKLIWIKRIFIISWFVYLGIFLFFFWLIMIKGNA